MTLITKTDIENELQITLPVGYTESNINNMADAAEDYLKLKTIRTTFAGSTASLAKKAVLYLIVDRLVTSDRDLVKSAIAEIKENDATIKFSNGKTLVSYQEEAESLIKSLWIRSTMGWYSGTNTSTFYSE
jgi:hypothetical protein